MSTLHVENLKGLSSGGNANKIIVPSGQTLHAPGHVIQMQHASFDGNANSTTGTSFVDTLVTLNITPKFATSKILVTVHQVVSINDGVNNTRCDFRCIESNSSTEIYRIDYFGSDGNVSNLQKNCSGSGVFQCSNTNQLTFKTQVQRANASNLEAALIYQNWFAGGKLTITALEIAQ